MTDENKSYVEQLAKEFYFGKSPHWIVDEAIKTDVEERIGTNLPGDYYEFINLFGFGSFSNYVKIENFFRPDGVEEYFAETECNAETMSEMKDMFGYDDDDVNDIPVDCFDEDIRKRIVSSGYGFPYNFFSKSNGCGLIYWGRTDDVDFYWNYTGDSYSIIVYMDDNCFYEFNMSFSEFLYNFLHGKMKYISGSFCDYTYEEYK
ncbi:MAG: hypothetical protein K2N72_01705 [Oscillospiraceae bacterium]|nr:hypothetical protein [Oscillospiraceae bacterium]